MNVLQAMFGSFKEEFPRKLQELLLNQKLHLTSKEALRCFLLGVLINIFQSPEITDHIKRAYLTTTSDAVFWFVVNRASQTVSRDRLEMFVFDLNNDGWKPKVAPRTKDNLIAMLIADEYGSLLTEAKFPKAKIVSIRPEDNYYKVKAFIF